MSEFTNILDLPTEPLGGSNTNNISINAFEKNTETNNTSNISLDQSTINQIVNGLQQATISGSTQLPSRDISMETISHNIDQAVQPNYIPVSNNPINNIEYINEDIKDNSVNQKQIDIFYNEIQMPLLIAALYFLFQLPIFKKSLYYYLPMLFSKDGNYNINGFLGTSFLFGFLYYILQKIIFHFNTF